MCDNTSMPKLKTTYLSEYELLPVLVSTDVLLQPLGGV